MITKQQIADYIYEKLNLKCTELDYSISFSVELDRYNYDWVTRNITDMIKITPCSLSLVNSSFSAGMDLKQMEYVYKLTILCREHERAEIREILDSYMNEENTINQTVTMGNSYIQKSTPQFTMGETLDLGSGDATQWFITELDFTWLVTDDVLTSDNVVFKIDGVEVPFTHITVGKLTGNVQGITDNGRIPKINMGVNSIVYQVEIVFDPNNEVVRKIYNETISNRNYVNPNSIYNYSVTRVNTIYNVSFTLKNTNPEIMNEVIIPMIMHNSTIAMIKPQLLSLMCEFSLSYDRVSFSIDNVRLPILSYNLELSNNSEIVQVANNDNCKGIILGKSRVFNFVMLFDYNLPPIQSLVEEYAPGSIVKREYLLNMSVDGNGNTPVFFPYTVIADKVTIKSEDNPTSTIGVVFIEVLDE